MPGNFLGVALWTFSVWFQWAGELLKGIVSTHLSLPMHCSAWAVPENFVHILLLKRCLIFSLLWMARVYADPTSFRNTVMQQCLVPVSRVCVVTRLVNRLFTQTKWFTYNVNAKTAVQVMLVSLFLFFSANSNDTEKSKMVIFTDFICIGRMYSLWWIPSPEYFTDRFSKGYHLTHHNLQNRSRLWWQSCSFPVQGCMCEELGV